VDRERDLVCFSHLRWDFVFQRPNHLMARAARDRRVFYVEEAVDDVEPTLEMKRADGVTIVVPHLPPPLEGLERIAVLRELISDFFATQAIAQPVIWYYTPMSFAWSSHLPAAAVVYDVMDDLGSFRFAPPDLVHLEKVLLARSDIVLTGGRQLYESRRARHANVHLYPSSVDGEHFRTARTDLPEPLDQAPIARPRLGYFGVIDERVDLKLLKQIAERRRDWQIVLVGPVTKIDSADIPQLPNVHALGRKEYRELPAYLRGWDVAIMPFALNDATRHISPTKTPEYLAGGRPVASTPIADVVDPYGRMGLVDIGSGAAGFERAIELALGRDVAELRRRADRFLATNSWDRTWREIDELIERVARRVPAEVQRRRIAVPVAPDAGSTFAADAGGTSTRAFEA